MKTDNHLRLSSAHCAKRFSYWATLRRPRGVDCGPIPAAGLYSLLGDFNYFQVSFLSNSQ